MLSQDSSSEPPECSKRSADSPSARHSLLSKLNLSSEHDSLDSDDDSSIEEYGVVCSVHTNSATSVKATDTVPSVPVSSRRYELNDTYEVHTAVATDKILPAYCFTCPSMHNPSSPLSTSLAVQVMEQKVEDGL